MSLDINDSFVKQYEAEVHEAFQRTGSIISNQVRTRTGVQGESTTFQVIGQLEAVQKTRHGVVPAGNASHDPILCTLTDWYAKETVDKLDLLKINHDERGTLVRATVSALGRRADTTIITSFATATTTLSATAGTMTLTKAMELVKRFGENDVPFDDNLFCAMPWGAWTDFNLLEEVSSSDWVQIGKLDGAGPQAGGQTAGTAKARYWMGIMWYPHSALSSAAYAWHRSAIGHAQGQGISTDVWWDGNAQSWQLTSSMSMGSCVIDQEGLFKITIS